MICTITPAGDTIHCMSGDPPSVSGHRAGGNRGGPLSPRRSRAADSGKAPQPCGDCRSEPRSCLFARARRPPSIGCFSPPRNALDLQELSRPVASDDRKAEPLRLFLQHNLHHFLLKVGLEFLVARRGWVQVRVGVPESSVWPHGGRFCLSLLLQGCCGLEAGGRFS